MFRNLRSWLGLSSRRPTRPPSVGAAPGGAVPGGDGTLAGLRQLPTAAEMRAKMIASQQYFAKAAAMNVSQIYGSAVASASGGWYDVAEAAPRVHSTDPVVREFFDQYDDDADIA